MARPNYSIVYTAILNAASANVAAGMCLVLTGDGSTYVPATASSMSGRMTIDGVSLGDASPLGAVQMQVDGVVPTDFTGLGPGALAYARVNLTTSRLERVTTPGSSDVIVGIVNEIGDVVFSMGGAKQAFTFNVRSFGAKGDNVTDDLPAFNACMAACKYAATVSPLRRGARFIVDGSAKQYFLNGDFHITAPSIVIEGVAGGGANGASQLRFATGFGIIQDPGIDVGAVDSGQYCIIRNLDIYGGGVVALKGDGLWHAGMVVSPGDKILSSTSYRMTLVAQNGGTAGPGPAEPTWDLTYPNQITDDNGIHWKAVSYAGITANNRINCEHLYIDGFTNAGICNLGNLLLTPKTYASGSTFKTIRIAACGTGITVGGGDGSAGYCTAIDVSGVGNTVFGYPAAGNGGIGLDDSSFLGWSWVACQVASTQGPGAVCDINTAISVLVGCYFESDCQRPRWNGLIIAGNQGALIPTGVCSYISANQGARRIFLDDAFGSMRLNLDLQDGSRFLGMTDPDSSGQTLAWAYESGSGEWYLQWGPQNPQHVIGITNSKAGGTGMATYGVGNWIDYKGHWNGKLTASYFLGVDAAVETDANVAFGLRSAGFRLEAANATPLAGTSVGRIVTTTGYTGVARTNGMAGTVGNAFWGIPATQIVVAGVAYRCTTGGTAAGAPPVFDPVVGHTTTDGSIVWTSLGAAPVYANYGKVYTAGTLTIATAGAYALNTTQASYEGIEATGAAANITVTTPYDGQQICVYNNSGGNITVVGFVCGNGTLFTGQYIGGGVSAWKKKSLF